MTRISKTVKNANPEVYGFEHPWDIPGNTKEKITVYCVSFEDQDGDTRWCECTKEYFEWDWKQKREERRKIDELTRCLIPSEKYGLVKCRHKCDECPYKRREDKSTGQVYYEPYERTGGLVSLEFMNEEYEYEFVDENTDSAEDAAIKQAYSDALQYELSNLDEMDRKIIELFSCGRSDFEIAEELHSKKSTIQYKRNRIIEHLREKLKNFK